ncbi:hypothetical protein K7432_016703, partial [Basidiobolus ranarum]
PSPSSAAPASIPAPLFTQKSQISQRPCLASSQNFSQAPQTQPCLTSKTIKVPSMQASSKNKKDFLVPPILLLQPTGLNLLEVMLATNIAGLFIGEVKDHLEWDLFDHTFRQHIDSPLFAPFCFKKELLCRFASLLKNSALF